MTHVAFGSLQIAFDDRVLRPRAWTEAQSAWAAEILETAPAGQVLELCAGAGQIGLLAVAGSTRSLVCVDLDPVACEFARRNAAAAGITDRVEVREGPMDEVLRDGERFALVIADPPWVRRDEVGRYPEDPLLAIDGGDGRHGRWPGSVSTWPAGTCCRAVSCCSSSGPSSRSGPRARRPGVTEVRHMSAVSLVRLGPVRAAGLRAAPCGCRRTRGATPTSRSGTPR